MIGDTEGRRSARVEALLRSGGRVTDASFDRLLPADVRASAELEYTPLRVCLLAARWLTSHRRSARILDVGSGAGKFCVVGALATRARFVGVEQREDLVAAATALARALHARRCSFRCADAFSLDWRRFDGLYLFNPFFGLVRRAPAVASEHAAAFEAFVRATEERLRTLRRGTRVVTFHGFGGIFPPAYRRVRSEQVGRGHLELWVSGAKPKRASRPREVSGQRRTFLP